MSEPGLMTALQPIRAITDERAELLQPGRDQAVGREHRDFRAIELHIGQNDARAEMHLVTENRIADVAEMRDLRFVKNDAVLELAGIAHDHPFPTMTFSRT